MAIQSKFCFTEFDGTFSYLSVDLAVRQGVSDKDLQNIVKVHERRVRIFKQIAAIEDPIILRDLARAVEEIEFELQRLWKLPQNRARHTWWEKVPKCKCPGPNIEGKTGNFIAGRGWRVIDLDCPIHG